MKVDTGKTPPTSKCIRFYEYASVIPCPDSDEPPSASSDRQNSPLAGSPPGRPRLCSRTYSVPIPSSFSSFSSFFGPSYGYCPTSPSSTSSNHIARDLADDPAFFPNAPPKLNVRIPTFTRRRRNTTSGVPSHGLRSCMKSEKGNLKSQAAALARTVKPRADPVYCPALAKVLRAAAAADDCFKSPSESDQQQLQQLPANSPPKSTPSTLSSSPPVLSSSPGSAGSYFGSFMSPLKLQRSNTSNTTTATAPVLGNPATTSNASLGTTSTSSTVGQEDDQVDLLPIRECCRACHRATRYGETCDDASYFEKFSKSALEKRKRDEETKYERGEYVVRKACAAPTPAEERERYREEIKKRNIVERSPDGSAQPLPVRSKSLSACGAMAQRIQEKNEDCHEELEREPEKKKQCLDELDMGRKKATETKSHDRGDGVESSGDSSSISSEAESEAKSRNDEDDEGEGLQLEGVPDLASGQADAHSRSRRASEQTIRPNNDEGFEEKNPICTLGASGELVPARSAVDTRPHHHHQHSHHSQVHGSAPRALNALPNVVEESSGYQRDAAEDDAASTPSSDIHDDVISSLGFLKGSLDSPAFSQQQQQKEQGGHDSPLDEKHLAQMLQGGLQLDLPASLALSNNTKNKDLQPKKEKREEEERPRCSPLIRSKACLRPSLYGTDGAAGASPQALPAAVAGMALDSSEDESATKDATPRRGNFAPPVAVQSQKERDAELLEALKAADKPLYFLKKRGAAASGESMNGGAVHKSAANEAWTAADSLPPPPPASSKGGSSSAAENNNGGSGRGWASRIFHPAKSLSSLGAAHGIVH